MFTPLCPTDDRAVFPGVSEFGRHMADCVMALPAARGAVLCDALGDPIDFAYRNQQISELDIQLCGAQLTQVLHQLSQRCKALAMPMQLIMLEAQAGTLMTTELADEFLLVLLLRHKADLSMAMRSFESLSQALLPLLA